MVAFRGIGGKGLDMIISDPKKRVTILNGNIDKKDLEEIKRRKIKWYNYSFPPLQQGEKADTEPAEQHEAIIYHSGNIDKIKMLVLN